MTDTEHARIELRADSAANWTAADPVLAAGEPGFELDTGLLKIGDGVTDWSALDYSPPSGGVGSGAVGADLTHSTSVPTAANGWTSHPFDTEVRDDGSFHNSALNNSRLVIPTPGWYVVSGVFGFPPTTTGAIRAVRFLVNGTDVIKVDSRFSSNTGVTAINNAFGLSAVHYFATAGDYVELQGYTSVTTPANANGLSRLSIVKVS